MILLVLTIFLLGCTKSIEEVPYDVNAIVSPFPIEAGVATNIAFAVTDSEGIYVDTGDNKGNYFRISNELGFNEEFYDTNEVTLTFPKTGEYQAYLEFNIGEEDPVIGDLTLNVK